MQTVCGAQRHSSVEHPNSKSANIYIYILDITVCPASKSSINAFISEVAGVRTKVQGQRDTTHQNLFQQNDPSQHLPTALQPALHKQLTSGCRRGNTHRSHQCASLHILARTRVTVSFFQLTYSKSGAFQIFGGSQIRFHLFIYKVHSI